MSIWNILSHTSITVHMKYIIPHGVSIWNILSHTGYHCPYEIHNPKRGVHMKYINTHRVSIWNILSHTGYHCSYEIHNPKRGVHMKYIIPYGYHCSYEIFYPIHGVKMKILSNTGCLHEIYYIKILAIKSLRKGWHILYIIVAIHCDLVYILMDIFFSLL